MSADWRGGERTNLYSGREPLLEARLEVVKSVYFPSDEVCKWLEMIPVYSYFTAPHRQLPLTILRVMSIENSGERLGCMKDKEREGEKKIETIELRPVGWKRCGGFSHPYNDVSNER